MRVNPSTFLRNTVFRQTDSEGYSSQVTLVNLKLVMTGVSGVVTGGGTQVSSDPRCCQYTVFIQAPFVEKALVVIIIFYKGDFLL